MADNVLEGFESFTRTTARPRAQATHPLASISTIGSITLNGLAVGLFGNEPDAVKLLYRASDRTIAMQPTSADDKNGFKLRKPRGNTAGAIIGAKRFFENFNIAPNVREDVEPEAKGGMVFVALPPEGEKMEEAPAQKPKRSR